MKRIISIILLTTMLLTMAACGQSAPETSDGDANSPDESYVYTPRDYLSEWADSECVAFVSDTLNDSAYVGLAKNPEWAVSYDEELKVAHETLARRSAAYLATHSLPETKEWEHFGKTELVFSEMRAFLKNKTVAYKDSENRISVRYNTETSKPVWILYNSSYIGEIVATKKEEGAKVVNSLEEAFEYAKEYIRKNTDVGEDADLYIPTRMQIYKVSEYNTQVYDIALKMYANGIKMLEARVEIDEYAGIINCDMYGYSKEAVAFYASCAEYAGSEIAQRAAVDELYKRAAANPDIVDIRNIRPYNYGQKTGRVTDDDKTDYIYIPEYTEYGRIRYIGHLDKTGVDLVFGYTLIMKDGSEKKGLNVVTVIIPIDWAEEFGEK